jgi:hypothetical protein
MDLFSSCTDDGETVVPTGWRCPASEQDNRETSADRPVTGERRTAAAVLDMQYGVGVFPQDA